MRAADYYKTRLSGERLRRCYEQAPPRIRQYLDAEVAHVVGRIQGAASVLELGCGYGRVLRGLVQPGHRTVGIDTSQESLHLARQLLDGEPRCDVAAMDACALGFRTGTFEAVLCIQNGICAFRVDPAAVFREALRIVRPGGLMLFSTYAEGFWQQRVQWFEAQAADGLVGEIDYAGTRTGEIVCKDGFRSGTLNVTEFAKVCGQFGVEPTLVEVDASGLFCEITTRGAVQQGAAPDGRR